MRGALIGAALVLTLAACGERQPSTAQPATGGETWREAPAREPMQQPRPAREKPKYSGKTY